jgi:hypothetical protein
MPQRNKNTNSNNNNGKNNDGGCGSCKSDISGGKSKKEKKAKRKPTAYNLFIKSAYARLKKLHPSDTAPEIMKKAAAEWRAKK